MWQAACLPARLPKITLPQQLAATHALPGTEREGIARGSTLLSMALLIGCGRAPCHSCCQDAVVELILQTAGDRQLLQIQLHACTATAKSSLGNPCVTVGSEQHVFCAIFYVFLNTLSKTCTIADQGLGHHS